jgi:guanylate kinase
MAKLILLSGPSCVGKGPLITAMKRFYPQVSDAWKKLVLYNSRSPRPGEEDGLDYHFRNRPAIEQFRNNPHYLVANVRGDLQAVDIEQLLDDMQNTDVFFEGNPFIVEQLLKIPQLQQTPHISIFLSPLSEKEIRFLQLQEDKIILQDFITDVMRRKLLKRTKRQKINLSPKDLEDIERRAASALKEMQAAPQFDHVIVNHDGEDSENWDAFYFPIGDALRTLECFAALIQGEPCPIVEKWPTDIFNVKGGENI